MDSARQLIRWGLPGWMTLLFLSLFILIELLFESWGKITPDLFTSLRGSSYTQIVQFIDSNLLALGVVSIPFGFLIHQLYYWMYWYAPLPSLFGAHIIAPVDRGREILDGLQYNVDFKWLFAHPLMPEGSVHSPAPFARRFWKLKVKSTEVMGSIVKIGISPIPPGILRYLTPNSPRQRNTSNDAIRCSVTFTIHLGHAFIHCFWVHFSLQSLLSM